jgi:hypothetical protein
MHRIYHRGVSQKMTKKLGEKQRGYPQEDLPMKTDVDEHNQEMLETLVEHVGEHCWSEWEVNFIESLQSKSFGSLSEKQKVKVLDLIDKLNEERV